MIRPMSKYSFLIFHKEYDEFLSYLQGLGVLHITERKKSQGEESLKALHEERVGITALIRELKAWLPEEDAKAKPQAPIAVSEAPEDILAQAELFLEGLERCRQTKRQISDQLAEQKVWGDFDPELLARLAGQGYKLQAYSISAPLYTEAYVERYQCHSITRTGQAQYFVRLEQAGDSPAPEAERINLPERSLSDVEAQLQEAEKQVEAYEAELKKASPRLIAMLEHRDKVLEDRFSLGAARLQGEAQAGDSLLFLEGWIPTDESAALEQSLSTSGYYYQQSPIAEADRVPISLKNNVFARGFELISKLYALPNYNEIDQTVLFAPFFMLFFGLCVGDAGYGLIILAVATYLRLRLKKGEDDTVYLLMQWLGGAAAVIGFLVGGIFGVTLPYAQGADYFLSQDNQMALAIVLGLLQIFFAKGVAAYKTQKQRGLRFALASYAWIIFLIAIGAMLGLPLLELSLPSVVDYILYAIVGLSGAIILFYNSPEGSILSNVGSALWAVYNNASGLLGDTLSYIRLFAIGLTGAVLGSVFNTLAIDATEGLNAFVRFPLMLLVLLVGHSINFGLAMIGGLVHPIRLIFVEYYKNSEFEGGGIAYSPLKQNITTEESNNK